MKKILTILLVLMLTACGHSNKKENYTITCPSGAPALALLDFVNDNKYQIDIVDGSDVLQAEFIDGNKDFIIAPLNLGVKLAKQTGNYKLGAVLTWGNLYLVSTENNFNNGKVAAFGEAAIPGKIINFLKDELNAYEFEWFSSVNEAGSALLVGKYQAAVVAEPFLTAIKTKSDSEIYEILNIQEVYKSKTNLSSYPQAALFINSKLENSEVKGIIDTIQKSIKENNDINVLENKLNDADIKTLGFENPKIIIKAFAKMGLDCVNANECRNEIANFLKLFDIEFDESIIY